MQEAKKYGLNFGAVLSRFSNFGFSILSVSREDRELTDSELEQFSVWFDKMTLAKNNDGGLTPKEKRVLLLLSRGYSQSDIAENSSLDVSTIQKRLVSARKKLGCNSTIEAVAISAKRNYI